MRKKAIEACNGEYICFLDVDDYWTDNKLEKQLSGQVSAKVEATKDPPQDQMQALMTLYNQQKLQQVFKETQVLTKRYANNLFLWNLMGISAAQLGKLDEAIHALKKAVSIKPDYACLLYTSPSPRDATLSRMPSSA